VLGFTNDNNDGVTGVESTYNNWLGGEDGTAYYIKDANQKDIPSLTRTVKEPVKGKDLVLTIDSNIQMITENALKDTINKWHAKSGTAIVMDAKNGEILAMATAPDFNLNNPYSVPAEFIATHKEDMTGKNDDEKAWNDDPGGSSRGGDQHGRSGRGAGRGDEGSREHGCRRAECGFRR
jgi:stage V sporulation protein D (sporulation-specific penicillin-binding protein)